MPERIEVKALAISDVHLGTPDSNSKAVYKVLKGYRCSLLVLLGDTFDRLHFSRIDRKNFSGADLKLLKYIKKLSRQRSGTWVVWVEGNHDQGLSYYQPFLDFFGSPWVEEDKFVINLDDTDYLFTHGHRWRDGISSDTSWVKALDNADWLARLIDRSPRLLFPKWLAWFWHQPLYYVIKQCRPWKWIWEAGAAKLAYNAIELARENQARAIVCGHVHQPGLILVDGIVYCNTGAWVDNYSSGIFVVTEIGPAIQCFDVLGRVIKKRQLITAE